MQDGPTRAHGGSCRWQDSIRKSVLGRCILDGEKPCASNYESCPSGADDWVRPIAKCTVESTSFGRCDSGMCAWSHAHCGDGNALETWDAYSEGCSCEQVQVGACGRLRYDEVFCAVSELACDREQTWIAPQEVKSAAGFECFLCREATSAVAGSTEEEAENMEVGSQANSSNTSTLIVATVITVAGSFIGVLIIGTVLRKVHRSRRAAKRACDGGFGNEEAPPTANIGTSNDRQHTQRSDETDEDSAF